MGAPPSDLIVNFDRFHQDIPSLKVHATGPFGGDRTSEFQRRIRDHVHRHMYARRDDLRISGHPDAPRGRVEVASEDDWVVAGEFSVAPHAPSSPPEGFASGGAGVAGVPPHWILLVVALVALFILV